MIGGRVLDASALAAFAGQGSVYVAALVWTAVEEGVVLLVPTTALAAARAAVSPDDEPVLDVLLGLPVTVTDTLDGRRALEAGELASSRGLPDLATAHAALCARDRSWPVVTARPADYAGVGDLETEELP